MGAIDIGFSGTIFTWCNKRGGTDNIRERIDKVLASPDWRILFPQAGVVHLHPIGLDHIPIKLTLRQDHLYSPRPSVF